MTPIDDRFQLHSRMNALTQGLALILSDRLLEALPAAIYTTDAEGRITFYNEAAATLWGLHPNLEASRYCGSWKLYWPDGAPMPHSECPTAMALRERQPMRAIQVVSERPDGSRVSLLAYPTPLFDSSDAMIGAVVMLVDVSEPQAAEQARQRLAAIVESSDDAIVSKDLNGTIMSWNAGARRLFGYAEEEIVGRSILTLIPEERHEEEHTILGRLRKGERIEQFETQRRRKDGSLVEVSLTVSPVRDRAGSIVGASKIARDITERRRTEERQRLLIQEMSHRVKNLFALSGSIVGLSAKSAKTPQDLANYVQERLASLARAHELTLPRGAGAEENQSTTLSALIETILSPYQEKDGPVRVRFTGCDTEVSSGAITSLALLLHELTTNAAKYGALSTDEGRIDVDCTEDGDRLIVAWRESGGPRVTEGGSGRGFGSHLAEAAVKGQLGGEITRNWKPEGLEITVALSRESLTR